MIVDVISENRLICRKGRLQKYYQKYYRMIEFIAKFAKLHETRVKTCTTAH